MTLDYETQRKSFLELAEQKKLRSSEVSVYLALLKMWRQKNWAKHFPISTWELYKLVHLANKTIINARRDLERKGFFHMEPNALGFGSTKGTVYQMFPLYSPEMV